MGRKQRKEPVKTHHLLGRALIIGLVGGLLWSTFLAISYYFSFSEIAPKTYLLKPWVQAGWVDRLSGHLIAIGIASVVSLIPAIIYYSLFQKINSMWVGVGYGIALWGAIFFVLQPLLPYTRSMYELSMDTWITTLCVFVLYGLFIGFSISYDYHELEVRIRKQRTEKG